MMRSLRLVLARESFAQAMLPERRLFSAPRGKGRRLPGGLQKAAKKTPA